MRNRKALLEEIRGHEGKVAHIYLDSRGNVTVGIGQLLRTAAGAKKLPFVHRRAGQKATEEEIEQEFRKIEEQEPNLAAGKYKRLTRLELPEEEIEKLFSKQVERFEAGARKQFKGFDGYPLAAQIALVDMAYNVGLAGLARFKRLKAAAERGDWKAAAEAAQRKGIGEQRNQRTKELFLKAAQGEPTEASPPARPRKKRPK